MQARKIRSPGFGLRKTEEQNGTETENSMIRSARTGGWKYFIVKEYITKTSARNGNIDV